MFEQSFNVKNNRPGGHLDMSISLLRLLPGPVKGVLAASYQQALAAGGVTSAAAGAGPRVIMSAGSVQ